MQPDKPGFVPTSIAQNMVARLTRNHKRRGISIFAGPPGIGKTTAIEAFADQHPGQVAVLKVNNPRASDRIVLGHAVEAIRALTGQGQGYVYLDSFQIRRQLHGELHAWAVRTNTLPGEIDFSKLPPFTFVFDEAQNFSRAAIEALRYWNDQDRCYGPFPIALAFIGNAEFSLQSGRDGQSVISAAVADRALYVETLEYSDLTNADISLFLQARGISDAAAIAAVVKLYSTPRTPRSLRSVGRIAEELLEEANGAPVTLDLVQSILNPV